MDRALDIAALTNALGSHALLPDPAELQQLLADTEIRLFTQQASIDEQLLDAGWYLQSVASARRDLQLYDLPRQRLAHQVSGHIFDLALQSADLSDLERLRYTFAAQVGYLGGQLAPNASAIALRAPLPAPPYAWSDPGRMSLETGVLVLALARPTLYPFLRARRAHLDSLGRDPDGLAITPYDAFAKVTQGSWALVNYLTYGQPGALDRAREFFAAAVAAEGAVADVDSRWVAAHLRRLCDDLGSTSVWAVMPPDLPSAAKAMTLGDPPVLTLWPPQLSLLASHGDQPSPLDPSTRRLVLSFPTSAGKTLLAQILITVQTASTEGEVCVVAPTHSLCREISISLDRRLRTLGYQLHQEGPLGIDLPPRPAEARVSVMTPEKLAAMLRTDPEELLARFSMFVIDEAHLVADGSRGWRLEETLSFLHHKTLDTDHRILVLSAALGNQVHVVQWMETGPGSVVHHHQDWRGPRRLNSIYTTEPSWDAEVAEPASGNKLARRHIPMRGVIRLSTGATIARGEFDEDVGTLVLRYTRKGETKKDLAASSKQREHLVPLVEHVAASGPVLIVEATRAEAQRVAKDVAESRPETTHYFALIDLTRTRLGEEHPLTQMVSRGVAFHHAALPIDIQTEVEDAVRSGHIKVLAATSTLTEGVNLPFKTVIIGSRGYRTADGEEVELIDGPGLLNAVGRAGRAGCETEGWVILAEQQDYSSALFDPLNRTGDDLDVRSALTTETALASMAEFELAARTAEDAVFGRYDRSTAGFLSFVWFVAQSVTDAQDDALADAVRSAVRNTLAWQQLDDQQRTSLVLAAEAALSAFVKHDPPQRSRWARSGTSLPTARTLESLALEIQSRITPETAFTDIVSALDLIVTDTILLTLLGLDENDRRGFKPHRNAPKSTNIDVDLKALLLDWVAGSELQELADSHLQDVTDEGFRYEQLAEFSASVFEHHLPWTLGVIIGWVNGSLETAGAAERLPDLLPGAIHYGVGTSTAIDLMTSGVRSRRLANRIAAQAISRGDAEQSVREWLADHSIAEWRSFFDASPTELADLLSYVRAPGAQSVSRLLDGETLQYAVAGGAHSSNGSTTAEMVPDPDAPAPAPIIVQTSSGTVGTVRLSDHDDVELILSMGIPLDISFVADSTMSVVNIALAAEAE